MVHSHRLQLDRVSIICPGTTGYRLNDKVTVVPLSDLLRVAEIAE